MSKKKSKLFLDKILLKRRHMTVNQYSISYIGKESNELEISEILGVFPEDNFEYSDSILIKNFIEQSSKEDFLKTGLSLREYYYLKKKINEKNFSLKKFTLKKILEHIKTNLINQVSP